MLSHGLDYVVDVVVRMGRILGFYDYLILEFGKSDVCSLCFIWEAFGYVLLFVDSIFVVQGLGIFLIFCVGKDFFCLRFFAEVRVGVRIVVFGLTESGVGSDVKLMQIYVVRDGDDYVLNGEKIFIFNVGIAYYVVIFIRMDDGFGVFVVLMD